MFDQVDRLQRENDQMRAELAALRGGVSSPPTRTRSTINEPAQKSYPRVETREPEREIAAAEETFESPISLASETAPTAAPAQTSVSPQPPIRALPTKPTAPSAVRRHVVVKGDTLMSLAQKYYGNRSRFRDIYAANRDLLPSEDSLRLGMEIRIP